MAADPESEERRGSRRKAKVISLADRRLPASLRTTLEQLQDTAAAAVRTPSPSDLAGQVARLHVLTCLAFEAWAQVHLDGRTEAMEMIGGLLVEANKRLRSLEADLESAVDNV